jgi:hypothetical protein
MSGVRARSADAYAQKTFSFGSLGDQAGKENRLEIKTARESQKLRTPQKLSTDMSSDTQNAASHNSRVRSSGKLGRNECSSHLVLAAQVARSVGMVESWPNVQIIRLAILAESDFSQVSPGEAAVVIVECAREVSRPPLYSPLAEWERRELYRLNQVDRFWLEDRRWRMKLAYLEFLRRRDGETAGAA